MGRPLGDVNVGLVVAWYLWFVLLGAVAFPVASWLLDPLELDGAGLSVPLGASVVTLVAFWAGHVAFGPATALLGVAVLAGLSGLSLRAGTGVSLRRYGEAMAVFGVAFAFAVGVRALTPQLHVWTEGYLNYGLLQSVLRSPAMPPEDMWFSGNAVQYHYGGHFALATWALLTDTPARYLPNVGLASIYAILLTGAYELAGTLGARRGGSRRLAGALGAVLLGVASNLFPPIKLLLGALPETVASPVASALSLSPRLLEGEFNVLAATRFGFTNTDFPLFSLWVQSFHGHVMSQPVSVLAAGLLCAYFLTPADERRRRVARLAAAIAVVGVVGFTNVWSLPMGAGLAALAVAFAPAHPASLVPGRIRSPVDDALDGPLRREVGRYAGGLAAGVVAGLGAMATVAPFFLATDASRPPGFLPDRSGLGWFVVGYGAFLVAFALFLWPRIRESLPARTGPVATRSSAVAAALALVAAGVALDFLALTFVAPVLAAGWWLLRRSDAVGFETVLILGGAGLALLVELVYVRGGAEPGRLNTAYKVYSQVWLIWSVAAGATLAAVVADSIPEYEPGWGLRLKIRTLSPAGAAKLLVVVLLVASLSLYAGFATEKYVRQDYSPGDGPSMDATRFLEVYHGDQAPAIRWLNDRRGQPRVLAAVPAESDLYRFNASAPPSLTGLPTVAGYSHAADYHSQAAYDRRSRHVRLIYNSSARVRAVLLAGYGVDYVYVGPYERARYDVAAMGEDPGIDLAFEGGDVRVYVVNESALDLSDEEE